MFHRFQTKDLGCFKYFLGIEVVQSKTGNAIFQWKYALNILEGTRMLDGKPIKSPMDPNTKLMPDHGESFLDPRRHRRLVGKLNYLTMTRFHISIVVSVVSQFLNSLRDSHWNAVVRIMRYIKGSPGKGLHYENKTDADWVGCPND